MGKPIHSKAFQKVFWQTFVTFSIPVINCDINITEITILKRTSIWNSMTNDFINWCTTGFGKLVIIEWTRVAFSVYCSFMYYSVNFIGGNSCSNCSSSLVQHFSSQSTSHSHSLNIIIIQLSNIGVSPEFHLWQGVALEKGMIELTFW